MVLLGAPGSGKGTQAKRLVERYKVPQISIGDLLRAAVASGSSLGRQAKAAMDAGQLVSDDIVLSVVQERLIRADARKGFILDGFPRNLQQAEALDLLLTSLGRPLNLALLIAVDVDALIQRLVGRRTCLSCGQMYNVFYSPPHIEGRCDVCGGRLRHRADDNEEIIGDRLRVYETHTLPVISYYQEQEKLRTVQGVGEADTVFKAVVKVYEDVKKHAKTESRSDAIRAAIAKHSAGKRGGKTAGKAAAGAGAASAVKPAAAGKKIEQGAAASRKTAPKKAAAGKATTKKAATGKATPKKVAAGKASPRKAATGKATPKKAATGKAAPGKAAAKKSVPKKAAPRKAAPKKAALKKPASKKAAPKKATPAKAVTKKAASKKAASGKHATVKKKIAGRKSRSKSGKG
ncbi:MAG TPA: adenylate kinase [Gammaproteobacteria bacterium]|nr:adenylate kinase [Gammaproteobacteria bacterium]